MPRSNSMPPQVDQPTPTPPPSPTLSESPTAAKPLANVAPVPAPALVASPWGPGTPVSTRTTGGFSWSIRLALDVDFAAPVTSRTLHPLPDMPLGGAWCAILTTTSAGTVRICMAGCRTGQLDRVEGRVRLFTFEATADGERRAVVVDKRFAPVRVLGTPGGFWTVEVTHDMVRKARGPIPLDLVFDMWQAATGSTTRDAYRTFLLGDSSSSPIRNDVRLFFPNVGPVGAEIWTSSHLLLRASPYFRAQLFDKPSAMDTSAPSSTSGGSVRPDEAPSKVDGGEVEDEDDGADARSCVSDADSDGALMDEFIVPSLPSSLFDTSRIAGFTPHELVVTERTHLFSTYRAVVHFLETGMIAFAPLYASCVHSYVDLPCPNLRLKVIDDSIATQSSPSVDAALIPLPVSPKSTYRLAVHLGLAHLARQCLHNLAAQLSPTNAAAELFSTISRTDAVWRGVVVEFVVRRWDEVVHGWRWRHEFERWDKRSGRGMNLFEVLNLVHEARLAHLRQRKA